MRIVFSLSFCILFVLCANTIVSADIYRYRDSNGVWHFTNVQTDARYRLYIRTYEKKSSEYMKEYEGIIQQASRRFNVDPLLVRAVIKAESDFDHRAVSKKGAQGLMQLMPQTATKMKVGNPFNPEENIFGGTRYLSLLLERFNNDESLALAAYNAGPEKVKDYQGIPPYPETKSFVRKVLAYYERLRSGKKE